MVEIVDEEVELHLIDTRQLVEEAKKLKEAQRIKQEQNKLLKKDPNQLREEKELLKRLKEGKKKSLTSSSAPTPFIGDVLPDEVKKQTRKGAVKGQNTTNAFKEAQKKIKRLEKAQKETQKRLNKWQDNYFDKLDTAKGFLSSGGATGLISSISSRFGPIGLLVASVITTLSFGFFEQFDRGGIFSIKLPITEREKNVTAIEMVVDVRSGTKFLTSDLRIAQKSPDTSNTQNLRYEHIRYVSQELGK